MSLCIVGIDNGISGGIAVISGYNGAMIDYCKMPVRQYKGVNEVDIRVFHHWISLAVGENLSNATFILESPAGSKSALAAKSMAGSFHSLRGFFEAKFLRWDRITPQKWQKVMLPKRKPGKTKVEALKAANAIWQDETFILPRCHVAHDGIVDAALIAEYWRREEEF